jgi:hypothetical protein
MPNLTGAFFGDSGYISNDHHPNYWIFFSALSPMVSGQQQPIAENGRRHNSVFTSRIKFVL